MTPEEFRASLARLGIKTQREAAAALGLALHTVQSYAVGRRPVQRPIINLLRLLETLARERLAAATWRVDSELPPADEGRFW